MRRVGARVREMKERRSRWGRWRRVKRRLWSGGVVWRGSRCETRALNTTGNAKFLEDHFHKIPRLGSNKSLLNKGYKEMHWGDGGVSSTNES